ncbi:MAG: histidinol-phosphatase (PHP family) [Saprospiraceae bacterium]|jgi:histidinol-phosphatase (PHP family)
MAWSNFHSHTHYCDGSNLVIDYLRASEKAGLYAYGFSSHAPTPYASCEWAMKREQLDAYCAEVNALKGSSPVDVYLSLEIDYVPNEMGPSSDWIKKAQLDYTIASVHFVDFHSNGAPWEIDGPLSEFEKGLKDIFHGNIQKAVTRYFEITRHMIENDCPQIIGHIDKIKMQNTRKPFFDEQSDWYKKELGKTMECVAVTDAIVEINTRGLYKKWANETYPGNYGMKLLKELNIPIMINSDGHHPKEIIGAYNYAFECVMKHRFKELWTMIDGSFQPCTFNTDGFLL